MRRPIVSRPPPPDSVIRALQIDPTRDKMCGALRDLSPPLEIVVVRAAPSPDLDGGREKKKKSDDGATEERVAGTSYVKYDVHM